MFLGMPRCQFLSIVVVIAIILICEELFKNAKMGKILLRICFVKILIFLVFSKVIRCNTEIKN